MAGLGPLVLENNKKYFDVLLGREKDDTVLGWNGLYRNVYSIAVESFML